MAAQSSTRIWENDSSTRPSSTSKPAQLPSIATLTNDLPNGNTGPASPAYSSANRSSDTWATPPQSTRSSAYSSGPNGYHYSSSISSPHRASNSSALGATSHPIEYHNHMTSAGAHPSPGFAPARDSLGLPNLNQQYNDPNQYRSSHEFPAQESRRSSIGSQVNSGFNNMHLSNGVPSPYNQQNGNQSQSSIAASLQRERGIPPSNGLRNSGTSHISHHQQSMSPLSPLPNESKAQHALRTAPIISANPSRELYNAEKPTVGQPYAFPDPDMSDPRSSGSQEMNGSTMLSRRDSDHTSVTSSIITNDSKLPRGQHQLDEDPMPGTHHHSLQHKQVSSLASEADSPEANSPYSRTPALRNSHKIAERKRRTEMKHLFEALRNQIPASHGSKSSKWEILSKASDHIRNLEAAVKQNREQMGQLQQVTQQLEMARQQNDTIRTENLNLFQEMQHYREQARPNTATAMHPQPSVFPPPAPPILEPGRSLPPLHNGVPASHSVLASNDMQGIQYSDPRR